MPFQIIRSDITKVKADAIVNTANPHPVIGGGTDSAVYRAAGEEKLLAERIKIGDIARGDAVSTPAFDLDARYIIHTVGPVWIDGSQGERETLRSCYSKSLELAADLSCESIAFPMISTGVYGFPKDEALDIVLEEVGKFLLTHEMNVTLVVFDRDSFELSKKLHFEIDEYIDENSVGLLRAMECFSFTDRRSRRMPGLPNIGKLHSQPLQEKRRIPLHDEEILVPESAFMAPCEETALSLDDYLGKKDDSFQVRLFKLIDERGLKDADVYKKANITRQVFSKIRCNPDYKPTKRTAVAFALALELDMDEMKDLLARAEIAMSRSSRFDLIIFYFVENHDYDLNRINSALFDYGEDTLGWQPTYA